MDFPNTRRRLTVNTKYKVDSINEENQTNEQANKKQTIGNRTKYSHAVKDRFETPLFRERFQSPMS